MRDIDLIEKVINSKLPLKEIYILGDGALLLYGIKKDVTTIKLCISKKLLFRLLRQDKISLSSGDENGFYNIAGIEDIQVMCKSREEFDSVKIGDLYLEDIRTILECKKSNVQKNQKDINSIERFLQTYPNYPEF